MRVRCAWSSSAAIAPARAGCPPALPYCAVAACARRRRRRKGARRTPRCTRPRAPAAAPPPSPRRV
eukprot:5147415-Pleurochrysis_carterae.AAC.1